MEDLEILSGDACTLPVVDRPVRLTEWDALLADHVRRVERHESSARIELSGGPGLLERARDLAARETACCSFFTFVVDGTDDGVSMEVSVPASHQPILDALLERLG